MSKVKLTAEQKKVLAEKMQEAKKMGSAERELFLAQTIGDVYDVELPINPITEAIADIRRADVGEHVYYNVPTDITKKVNTISANCNITQTKVTPNARQELSFTNLVSEEIYVCVHDWIAGDHDVLELNADMIMEAMDRQEVYNTVQLIDAGAVSEGNTFTLRSGESKFVYPDLVDMARSVAKFGRRLILITGANVTTDLMLLNYDADKNQSVNIFDIVDEHIPVEECKVTIDGGEVTAVGVDNAYLIAVSDSKNNKPQLMARRKTNTLAADPNAAAEAKERVVYATGTPLTTTDPLRKLAKGFVGFQSYGQVSKNDKVYAKFTRS